MTRDDIIKLAREAGIFTGGHPMCPWSVYPSDLERFAALVATHERESCAALLDANAAACENPIYRSLLQANAEEIRSKT